MSTADAAPRSFFRDWFPFVVLLAAPLAGLAVWYWPSDWEPAYRVMALMALAAGSLLLLGVWLLFLSRFPLGLRAAAAVLVVAGLVAFRWGAVREIHVSGDMIPRLTFRWEKTHDDVLEEHRRRQAEKPAAGTSRAAAPSLEFLGFFGNQRDGVVKDSQLRGDWKAEPPKPLWRQPVGGGYAGFAVRGGGAVTIEQRRGEEAVVCYDVASGRERWRHDYPAHFQEKLGGPGPRATPIIDPAGARVYSLGAEGKLVCLDLDTGREVWSADILKSNGNLPWGMAASPLFVAGPGEDDGEVIVAPGAQDEAAKGRSVLVYDARSGKELRAFGNHVGGYSSPVVARLCGTEQLLVFDGDGLTGYDPKAGKELWHHPWATMQAINVAQPLVLDGDRVFLSSGYGVGCAMLRVRKDDKPEVLWQNKLMRCKFTSPVHRDGYLYGLDEGILVCLDAKTGERKWKGGRYGHGQILLADRYILVLSESGDLALVEATPEADREVGRFAALDGKTWNAPALSRGSAFVRNDTEMACYELPGTAHSGCSHRVTTDGPFRVERRPSGLAVEGTPADCVRVALHDVVRGAAWVLSGINAGGNLGADVYISGTVAAVREAVLHGYPGVALSQYRKRGLEYDWSRAARWAALVLRDLTRRPWHPGLYWNVNLPHLEPGAPDPEVVFCPLDPAPLPLDFRRDGELWHYAGDYHNRRRRPGADVDVCFRGGIAVTALELF
jgi:outer membrane protein assembly factor BamB